MCSVFSKEPPKGEYSQRRLLSLECDMEEDMVKEGG